MQKTILITGAAKGIGYCCAIGLKERGYRVFATARRPEDLANLQQQGLEAISLDLNDSDSITQLVSVLIEKKVGIDALINNAGYGQIGAVEDLRREDLRAQFETNVFGLMELTNQIIPLMRRQGHGRIINISSILGLVAMPYRGAYNAAKFALEGLSDTLRQELTGTGIKVILIEPGPIESNFREQARQIFLQTIEQNESPHAAIYKKMAQAFNENKKQPFMLPPSAVLKKIIHALESANPKIRYYVTFPTYALTFLKWLLPARTMDWIVRKM